MATKLYLLFWFSQRETANISALIAPYCFTTLTCLCFPETAGSAGRGAHSNAKLFLLFPMLFFASSVSGYHHPGQGHHQTRCVFGMAAAGETQRSHPRVRGQVLREGEMIYENFESFCTRHSILL